MSTIKKHHDAISTASTLLSLALLSRPINLRAALLESLDHQPRHPPKKGARDGGVNRARERKREVERDECRADIFRSELRS
jgi:hypothetical protein